MPLTERHEGGQAPTQDSWHAAVADTDWFFNHAAGDD